MAKVKVSTSGLISTIKRAFKELGRDVSMYAQIINFSVERIRQRARLSKRMENNGGEAKLPELSDAYKRFKSELSPGDDGTDPTFFKPNAKTSNLTFSGQLLKSLSGKVEKQGPDVGKMSLEFTGSRTDGKTNNEVYQDLTRRDEGYRVLALDNKATRNIRSIVLTKLRQELKKLKLQK